MEAPKPTLTEFGIHIGLESCAGSFLEKTETWKEAQINHSLRDIGNPTVNIYGIRVHSEKVNLSPPSSSGHLKIILQNFSNFYLLKLQNCLLFDVHGWFNKAEVFRLEM